MTRRARALVVLTALGVGMAGGVVQSQDRRSVGWIDYGGGPDSSKFVDLRQITPARVGTLRLVWTYPTTNLSFGKVSRESGPWTEADGVPPGPSAYVGFALPEPRTASAR